MSVQAHPRFLRRRTTVREHRARRHLRRALWGLIAVAALWAVAWLAQSPLFSVRSIDIAGQTRADVWAVLEASDVYEGRPLVLIRSGAVAAALEADPWVKEASVHRGFPDQIGISVTERYEVAVAKTRGGWSTLSDDGHVMRSLAQPPAHLAVLATELGTTAGGVLASPPVMALIEFVQALPGTVIAETVVDATGDEVVATVAGHHVRLGTPTNMEAKAAALVAVLGDVRLASGDVIDLIAPSRPAVRPGVSTSS